MNYWKNNFFFKFQTSNNFLITQTKFVNKFNIFNFFFGAFFFDDIFSAIIIIFSKNFLILPSFFIFDKFISLWLSTGFFKKNYQIVTNFFYFEKIDFFYFIFFLLLIIPITCLFIFYLFFFIF